MIAIHISASFSELTGVVTVSQYQLLLTLLHTNLTNVSRGKPSVNILTFVVTRTHTCEDILLSNKQNLARKGFVITMFADEYFNRLRLMIA